MCSMTITILLSRRIIRSVPLLKGKKAEAPSLPDDPPIGLHAHGFLQLPLPPLIDRPFVHPFKKEKKKRKRVEERPLSSFGKKFVVALPSSSSSNSIQSPLKVKMDLHR